VNREPQLESLLRTLKLPGMADMLGERLAQAAASKLGHAELLGLRSAATRSPAAMPPGWPGGCSRTPS